MAAFDVSAIENYAYQNVNNIIGLTLLGLEAVEQGHISVMQNVREETGLTTFKAGNLGQPYRLAFEPKNDVFSFGYRSLKPKMGKVDLVINPLEFRNTWLNRVMRAGIDSFDIPYEQFFWEQLALKLGSEINHQSVFAGVLNPAGNSTTDVATGFGKIIADEITASNLDNVVATGAITATNAVSKLESMAKALPAAYRKPDVRLKMYMSYAVSDLFLEDYRTRYGGVYDMEYIRKKLDGFQNIELVPAGWLNNSQRVILTPMENLVMGTDLISDLNKIEMVKDIRTLKLAIHFILCYEIADLESIWVSDQA